VLSAARLGDNVQKHMRAVGLAGIAWMLALSGSVAALDPQRPLSSCVVRSWGVKEGLPSGFVKTVAQTPDGDLWIGTAAGLVRFDGIQMEVFDRRNTPVFEADEVHFLAVDEHGTLWVQMATGVIARRSGTGFEAVARGVLGSPWRTPRGPRAIVFARAAGETGALPPFLIDMGPGASATQVAGCHLTDRSGREWHSDDVGRLVRRANGREEVVLSLLGKPLDHPGELVADHEGRVWLTCASEIYRFDGDKVERFQPPGYAGSGGARSFVDRSGCVWFGQNLKGGLLRVCGDRWEHLSRPEGLLGERVFDFVEDSNGAIWVATVDGGVTRISDGPFTLLTPGLSAGGVQTLLPTRDGGLWVGTTKGLDRLDARGRVVASWGERQGLGNGWVTALAERPDGTLYAATRERGLYRLDGARAIPAGPPGTERGWFFSLLVDGAGTLWAGADRVWRLASRGWESVPPNGGKPIYRLLEDRAGELWAATGGLWRFDRSKDSFVPQALPQQRVEPRFMSVLQDRTGRLWFGSYQLGAAVRDESGRFRILTRGAGLADDTVESLVEDGLGNLWCAGSRWPLSASRSEIDAFFRGSRADLRWRTYNEADGIPQDVELRGGTGLPSVVTSDGRVWFAASKGLLTVDPATVVPVEPVPAYLTSVRLDGESRGRASALAIPPGNHRLEVSWSARYLRDPGRVRFRHCLSGWDAGWIDDASARRADYVGVRAGRYTFEGQASADGATWGPSASLAVLVGAYWWQRPAVWIGTGLFSLALVVAAARARGARLRRRAIELEETVRQRSTALGEERAAKERAQGELERKRELESLVEFGKRVSGLLDPGAVLDELDRALVSRFGDVPRLVFARREGRPAAARFVPLAKAAHLRDAIEAALDAGALGAARRLEDADARSAVATLRASGLGLMAPLVSGETTFGVIATAEPEHDRDSGETAVAQLAGLAAQAAGALEGAWQAVDATRWKHLSEARQEWGTLDPVCRLVFAAAARANDGAGADEVVFGVIEGALGARAPSRARLESAIGVLVERGILERSAGSLRVQRPAWLLLPELRAPLAELAKETLVRVGAYSLVERIGAGGMGEVWRAVNAHDGSPAAVKLLYAEDSVDEEARRRLAREGDIVARLRHPNVVRLLEKGEHEGRLYLAMELLEGETLAETLKAGPLSDSETLDAARQVLSALAELHAQGVVHRDVNANNIFRCRDGRYALLDFGLARGLHHSTVTRAQQVLGTLPYMAPEQLRGEEVTARADLWSFGIVVYEMVTGVLPWGGVNTVRMAIDILSEEERRLELPEDVDPRLRSVIAAVLKRAAEERPASALEVLSFVR
jgi:ligand-binding sensor domain-containing protein